MYMDMNKVKMFYVEAKLCVWRKPTFSALQLDLCNHVNNRRNGKIKNLENWCSMSNCPKHDWPPK